MVALWKVLSVAAVGAQGVRVKRSEDSKSTVSFGGVPVLNFDKAFDGAFQGRIRSAEKSNQMQDWVLVATEGTTDKEMAAMCQQAKCVRQGSPDNQGVPFFEIRGTVGDLKALLENSAGKVKFAEPDLMFDLGPELEGDQSLADQSARTLDDKEARTWGLTRIGAPGRPKTAGSGVMIYIADTGVRNSHNDFGKRVVPIFDLSVSPPVLCNGDLSCALDVRGHGTHCAGTAAGSDYGVAPNAVIGAMKSMTDAGSGPFSWSFIALDYAASSPIRPAVISKSSGGEVYIAAYETAVDAAVNAGVVVVVASGNSNHPTCNFSPAYVPSAISVGSSTSNDERSYFSNWGKCNNLYAPGSEVVSLSQNSDTGLASKDGTSMACPHVSGAAALILAENSSLTPNEVFKTIQEKSIKDALRYMRGGEPNMLLWVSEEAAPTPKPLPPVLPSVCDKPGTADLNFFSLCTCDFDHRCSRPDFTAEQGCGFFAGAVNSQKYYRYGCTDCKCVPRS